MVPIPGTVNGDGGLDRAESGGGNACIMLSSAKDRKVDLEASRLMKWWTGAAAQTQYGYELEATLGVASRYYPASIEAFKNIGWTTEEYDSIYEQWKNIRNIPQIPGNYLVFRSLTNALRSTIDNQASPRRTLTVFNKDINEEIARKRREFHLD
jgi:hypothetical protein